MERDASGKFVRGHHPVNEKDTTTGRFSPKKEPVVQLIPTETAEETKEPVVATMEATPVKPVSHTIRITPFCIIHGIICWIL